MASGRGLLGPNGAVSTPLKAIAGALAPSAGKRLVATLAIGYFAQHQVEQLRADESPPGTCRRSTRGTRAGAARFGGFDFAATWS
jgi:ATP-binding cassette subfamily F protein 3